MEIIVNGQSTPITIAHIIDNNPAHITWFNHPNSVQFTHQTHIAKESVKWSSAHKRQSIRVQPTKIPSKFDPPLLIEID